MSVTKTQRTCYAGQTLPHSSQEAMADRDPGPRRRTTLPPVLEKFTYILVIVDKFSKYVCLKPCVAELTAADIAQNFSLKSSGRARGTASSNL